MIYIIIVDKNTDPSDLYTHKIYLFIFVQDVSHTLFLFYFLIVMKLCILYNNIMYLTFLY